MAHPLTRVVLTPSLGVSTKTFLDSFGVTQRNYTDFGKQFPMIPLIALRQHRGFLILIAFAAVLFLSDIWVYREFVRAESYFALGARSMVERAEWLTPHAPDEL